MIANRRTYFLLTILLALLWFGTIDQRRLINPDEGRYAEIPREMVASGDWITPRLNDLKYFDKPPLQYWATATAYTLFGEHHWTARLWPALTGFLGIVITALATARLFSPQAGLVAAAVLAGSVLWNLIGHLSSLDMSVSFFLSAAIFSFCLSQDDQVAQKASKRWLYCAWALLAMAFLSKGLIGLVLPAATVIVYVLWQRDWQLLKRMKLLHGVIILLVIAGPWLYAVSMANPEFAHFFFIHEHFERFLTKVHGRYQPAWYFIPILVVGMVPWLTSFVPALVSSAAESEGKSFQAARFLLVWVVLVFVFFSISSSKLASYILPLFPAIASLLGVHLAKKAEASTLHWQAAPAIAIGALSLVLVSQITRLATNGKIDESLYLAYQPWLYAAAGLLMVGGIVAFTLARRGFGIAAIVVLGFSGFGFGQAILLGHDDLAGGINSSHDIVDAIRQHAPDIPPEVPFFSVQTYDQSFQFYLRRLFLSLVQK